MPEPLRAAILVSDHGWGHDSRAALIAREIVERGGAALAVASPGLCDAMRRDVSAIAVLPGMLDRGYRIAGPAQEIDHEASLAALRESLRGPPDSLLAAVVDWRPDIVLADATPWAPLVAGAAGVPAMLCSNFSWDDQYESLFGPSDEVRRLRAMVARFDLGLELPFGSGLAAVPRREAAPLLARLPAGGAPGHVPGVNPGMPLVTWAMGRTPPAVQPLDVLPALAVTVTGAGAQLAVSERVADAASGLEATVIPEDVDWPALLTASRVAVSKAGYSTVCETLRGSGYAVLLGLTGLVEERSMIAEVERRGAGVGVDVAATGWRDRLLAAVSELLAQPPRAPMRERGERAIVDRLVELVEPAARD